MRKKSADPAREAWKLVMDLLHAQKARHQSTVSELQLTPAQSMLLFRVEPDHPIAMSDLASQLFCDASNITGLVDKLESRDLIERQASTEDRRVKMIALTKAGAMLRAKLFERFYEPPPAITALSEADKKALRDILRKATQ